MADLIGQQLGNYRIVRLIGRGGFADAYLGEHIYLKTQVAIKILQAKVASDEDLEGFLKEAQTIAHLIHPNVVRVTDFGVEAETPFLVMDYAPNGTLRQRHPKGTTLPLTTITLYVRQVATALQYAHDEKLIHRDIKPENMLLGRKDEVLLSDFGIALAAQSSRYQSTQDVVGTVAYMSPEQIQGKPRPASDQYSLGVVVYEWLSGDRPFRGSFTELCTQHMFAPPPPLRERVPGISSDVEQVVTTALAKDPKQRFGSVQAFANALDQANQSKAPPALQPPSIPEISSLVPPTQAAVPRSFPPTQIAPPPPPAQIAPPPPLKSLASEAPYMYGANQSSQIPGRHEIVRTDDDAKVKLWSFGKRRVMAALLGIVIFSGLSYSLDAYVNQSFYTGPLFNPIIPALGFGFGLYFNWYSILYSAALIIPLFLAVEFGPWVGPATVVLSTLIANYLTSHTLNIPWYIYVSGGLFAFVPGFVLLATKGQYNNRRAIVVALWFSAVGIVIFCIITAIGDGISFPLSANDAFGDFFGDVASFIVCLVLLPILLLAYNAITRRKKNYS